MVAAAVPPALGLIHELRSNGVPYFLELLNLLARGNDAYRMGVGDANEIRTKKVCVWSVVWSGVQMVLIKLEGPIGRHIHTHRHTQKDLQPRAVKANPE